MRAFRTLFGTFTCAVLLSGVICAEASEPRLDHVDGAASAAGPHAQVELTQVFAEADPMNGFSTGTQTVECAFFINHGPKVVRRVRVRWTYTSIDGPHAGAVVGEDTKDILGSFAVGVPIETWPRRGNALGNQCQTVQADIAAGHLRLWKTGDAARLSAEVEAVDFADGTSWTARP